MVYKTEKANVVYRNTLGEINEYEISPDMTIRQFLESIGTDYVHYFNDTIKLDGTPLTAGQFDMTFADFNIKNKCALSIHGNANFKSFSNYSYEEIMNMPISVREAISTEENNLYEAVKKAKMNDYNKKSRADLLTNYLIDCAKCEKQPDEEIIFEYFPEFRVIKQCPHKKTYISNDMHNQRKCGDTSSENCLTINETGQVSDCYFGECIYYKCGCFNIETCKCEY